MTVFIPLRGFILDLGGTVYLSDRALSGAVEIIAALRQRGFKVAFISNKPLEPGAAYAARLTRLGIPTGPGDVITSGYVLSLIWPLNGTAVSTRSKAERRSVATSMRRPSGNENRSRTLPCPRA